MKGTKWTTVEKRRAQLHKHGVRIGRRHTGKWSERGWYAIQRDLQNPTAPRTYSGPHKGLLTAVGYGERLLVEHRAKTASTLLTTG